MPTNYYAALKCPRCEAVSTIKDEIDMYNKINPQRGHYRVEEGQTTEFDLDDIESDFVRIKYPETKRLRCVEWWYCPTCRQQNFAEIVFLLVPEGSVVEKIESVVMTSAYLDEIHYLSELEAYYTRDENNQWIISSLSPPKEEIERYRKILNKR